MNPAGLQKFVEILRSGDPEAIDRLLAEFSPSLRRVIRARLGGGPARNVSDTTDILQSLLKDLLDRKGTGATAASSGELQAYLKAAARYKVAGKVRKERKRAANRSDFAEPVSPEGSPAKQIDASDMHDAVRSRLDANNRQLLDLLQQGNTWRQIAMIVGGHPDSLRIKLRRSIATALAGMREQTSGETD